MRLLVSFLFLLAAFVYIQALRPDCSMSNVSGVEWMECLAR
jgi:hypothetical protein